MTSGMLELPGDSDYGLEFNYANWTPNTRIELLNVRWDNSYQDIVVKDSKAEFNAWIDNQSGTSITFDNLTYASVNKPVDLDIPFNLGQQFNYMRVYNRAQFAYPDDTSKYFYYFINDVEFISGNNTRFNIQLDVISTFIYDVDFGQAYLERGHYSRIYDNDFLESHGRNYHTSAEGFDLGNDLAVWGRYKHELVSGIGAPSENKKKYSIMVTSTVELKVADVMAQTNTVKTANGSSLNGLPNGMSVSFFKDSTDFNQFMQMISNYPIVSQGITNVFAVPDITDVNIYGGVEESDNFQEFTVSIDGTSVTVYHYMNGGAMDRKTIEIAENWRDDIVARMPERYRGLKKFFTSPYCEIQLTSNSGNPVVLHPENLNTDNIRLMQVIHLALPNPRIMFVPLYYNQWGITSESDGHGVTYDGGDFYDVSTGIDNLPTFSVVNNSYMNYLSQNKAGLAFQAQSNDWSQNRATMGAQLSYQQATQGMANSQEAFNANMSAMSSNHVADMGFGFGKGMMGLGGGGTVAGDAVNMAMSLGENAVRYGISVDQQNRLNNQNQYGMKYNRDTNMDFAQKAIAGDNEIARAGLSAKIQDAKTMQPSVSAQAGGDSFMLANNYWGCEARIKMVTGRAMASIGEHWLRFGYALNDVCYPPKNLKVMSNFTYWKLREVYIVEGNIPESFKRVIVGVLKNGVTVWNDPDKIGMIDWVANEVVWSPYP